MGNGLKERIGMGVEEYEFCAYGEGKRRVGGNNAGTYVWLAPLSLFASFCLCVVASCVFACLRTSIFSNAQQDQILLQLV